MAQSLQEPAASKVGRLSEVISNIVHNLNNAWNSKGDLTIFGCTLVNSRWNFEANRHLWRKCGVYRPTAENLFKIESHRRQGYANHVSLLQLKHREILNRNIVDAGSLQSELALLSFPILEELVFDYAGLLQGITPPMAALIQYAQPMLKRIWILANIYTAELVVFEELILALTKVCTKLEFVTFRHAPGITIISTAALTAFVHALPLLVIFCWQLSPSLSAEAFQCLAHKPELTVLEVATIPDVWVDNLRDMSISSRIQLFPRLFSLTCSASSSVMRALLPLLPRLGELQITAHSGSVDMFKVIANAQLKCLKELGYQTCIDGVIHAKDVLSVAKSSPKLKILHLAQDIEASAADMITLPILEGFTIESFEETLHYLGDLDTLVILSESYHFDQQLLIMIGSCCPAMARCSLTLKCDWKTLVQSTSLNHWPRLKRLEIEQALDEEEVEEIGHVEDDTDDFGKREIAEALLARMPSLHWLEVPDWRLGNAVESIFLGQISEPMIATDLVSVQSRLGST